MGFSPQLRACEEHPGSIKGKCGKGKIHATPWWTSGRRDQRPTSRGVSAAEGQATQILVKSAAGLAMKKRKTSRTTRRLATKKKTKIGQRVWRDGNARKPKAQYKFRWCWGHHRSACPRWPSLPSGSNEKLGIPDVETSACERRRRLQDFKTQPGWCKRGTVDKV